MEIITINNKNNYTLKTEEGRVALHEYIKEYNNNLNELDPIAKEISINEALALTNIEEFIKTKPRCAEIVRESIEIGLTTDNFKTNTIYSFARRELKKAGYNSIIRTCIENYIKFRLHITDTVKNETLQDQKFKYITTLELDNKIYYYNNITHEDLTADEIEQYKQYLQDQQKEAGNADDWNDADALPF